MIHYFFTCSTSMCMMIEQGQHPEGTFTFCWSLSPSAGHLQHSTVISKGCSANAVTVIKKYIQTLYSTIYKQKWKMVRKSIKAMHSPPHRKINILSKIYMSRSLKGRRSRHPHHLTGTPSDPPCHLLLDQRFPH